MGGFSAKQLLKHINYDLAKKDPEIICGLSDITVLAEALYAKTGIVTYYGPHFTMLGASKLVDYSLDNMRKTFFSEDPCELTAADQYGKRINSPPA
jgi:muramoyltetrapeptide carboxypeptidase